jgi:uncharacterized membrane protein (DUF373 family)
MAIDGDGEKIPQWRAAVERFGELVVVVLALVLVIIVAVILAVIFYLFATNVGTIVRGVDGINDIQQAALRAFSGILLVLLGLELLDTVKVYFQEHNIRVELVLLVGLIAMGRHVLEIDLHHIDPLILFGFSSLILALAASYFLVKRARS